MKLLNLRINPLYWLGLFICALSLGTPQLSLGQDALVQQWAFNLPASPRSTAYSTDGTLVAVSSVSSVSIFSVATQSPDLGILLKSGNVELMQFSPDGKTLAIAKVTGEFFAGVEIWNYRTGIFQGQFTVSGYGISSMAFSPNGQDLVLSESGAGSFETWNVSTLKRRSVFKSREVLIQSLAYSRDGLLVAVGGNRQSGGEIELWNTHTGLLQKSLFAADLASVGTVVFPPDRVSVACVGNTSSGTAVVSWTIQSGILKSELRGNLPLSGVALSPNATQVVTSQVTQSSEMGQYYQSTTLQLWDVSQLQAPITTWAVGWSIGGVAFSPDGSTVTTSATLYSWTGPGLSGAFEQSESVCAVCGTSFPYSNTSIVMLAYPRGGPVGSPVSPSFSYDENLVAGTASFYTGTEPNVRSFVNVWDTASGNVVASIPTPASGGITAAFSPDDTLIALTGEVQGVALHSIKSGSLVRSLMGGFYPELVVFSPVRNLIAMAGNTGTGDDVVQLWDYSAGKLIKTFTTLSNNGITGLTFTKNGLSLIVGGNYSSGSGKATQGVVEVWDVTSGKRSTELSTQESDVSGVTLSPDQRNLVVSGASQDPTSAAEIGRIESWSLSTNKLVSTAPLYSGTIFVSSAWFSKNGSLIYASTYGGPNTVQVIDVVNNKLAGYISDPYWGSLAMSSNATLAVVTNPIVGITVCKVPPIISAPLKSLSFSPSSLTEFQSTIGTVTLTHPAPPGGITVGLEMTSPFYSDPSLPPTVFIPSGKTTATFTMEAPYSFGVTQYTVTAISGTYSVSTNLTVTSSG